MTNCTDKDSMAIYKKDQTMETAFQSLEDLFYKKIMLYQELVEYLQEEQACLIKTDMEALWEVSEKKQSIAQRIEAIQEKMLTTLQEASIVHQMNGSPFSLTTVLSLIPHQYRERFRKPYLSLVHLKAETKQRSQENKQFVEKSLDFLDELIGILTNVGGSHDGYTNGGAHSNTNHVNLLLHKEV
jgi:flagellar biosynthesis/type III secretory pathway chaperone